MDLLSIKPGDWTGVRKNFQKIGSIYLGNRAIPTFAELTLTGLTASLLVSTDANKQLESVSDLTAWIAGTANQITVTDDADGTLTLSTPQDIHTDASPTFDALTLSETCTAAGGLSVLRVTGLQTDGTAMTGTLRGAYIDVSNGSTAATGTIRGMELKARTEAPGDTGNDVTVLEGLSISADSKDHSVTTMRAAEFILDGSTGGTITEAVGLRIANNLQANKATTSYGLQIYRDSFDYTADIQLSDGSVINKSGNWGVGVANPDSPLQINGLIHQGTGTIDVGTHNNFNNNIIIDASNPEVRLRDDVFDFILSMDSSGNVSFDTEQAVTPFYISVDGKIGIRTVSPGQQLVIQESTAGTSLVAQANHADNTNVASHARFQAVVAGANGGDPSMRLTIAGVVDWSIGVDNSDSDKLMFGDSGPIGSANVMTLQRNANIGFGGETAPETLTEWTGTAPYLTIHNSTHEDTDGGRESKLIFKGEQSGGEETILAQIEVSHDGSSDDQLGKMVYSVNTGAGIAEGLRINSNADVDIVNDLTAGTIQADNGYTGSWTNAESNTVTVVGGVITDVS